MFSKEKWFPAFARKTLVQCFPNKKIKHFWIPAYLAMTEETLLRCLASSFWLQKVVP